MSDAKEAKQEHAQEATAGSGGSYNTKGGWWYPTAAVRTTVSMPQLGICDDSAPDGVTNQGNKEGEWFWCDSRLQVS